MAQKKAWSGNHINAVTLTSDTSNLYDCGANAEAVLGLNPGSLGDVTLLRMFGTIQLRAAVVGNTPIPIFLGFFMGDNDLDAADVEEADWQTQDPGFLWATVYSVTGFGGDTTSATNLLPMWDLQVDSKAKRRLDRRNRTLWLFARNTHASLSAELTSYCRFLWGY